MPLALLLADDDALDRKAVRRVLEAAGVDASVTEASEAEAALAALKTGGIDCALLDYYLPEVDGLELLQRAKALAATTPIIVLTSQEDERLAIELMKAGAADCLSKQTLTPYRLERSIRHALAMSRADVERRHLLEGERAARQEAQAANRAKDEFLARLSHELRTPLHAILGWARLLSTGTLDAAASVRALETIERNARVQARLIEELLDISRVVAGKMQLDLRPMQLSELLTQVVDSQRPSAAAKRLSMHYEQHGTERAVMCDPPRIDQIIGNLLSNAIKFTPEGGAISVTLTCDVDRATLMVKDNGIGITPEFLPYVFTQFLQADSSTTRRHGGLGLGLSIVQHLVELHSGHVMVESQGTNLGATFIVTLPMAKPA